MLTKQIHYIVISTILTLGCNAMEKQIKQLPCKGIIKSQLKDFKIKLGKNEIIKAKKLLMFN